MAALTPFSQAQTKISRSPADISDIAAMSKYSSLRSIRAQQGADTEEEKRIRAERERAHREFLRLEKQAEAEAELPPPPIDWLSVDGQKEQLKRIYDLYQECSLCGQIGQFGAAWVGSITQVVFCGKVCITRARRDILLSNTRRVTCKRCRKRVDPSVPGFVLNSEGLWHERCLDLFRAASADISD